MNIIILEFILVAVVALGLGFWQLYDVNKALKQDREKSRAKPIAESDSATQAPDQVTDMGNQGSRQPDPGNGPAGPGQDRAQRQ